MKKADFVSAQKKVMNYLEKNPGSHPYSVKDATSVSMNVINRIIRDGLIVYRGYFRSVSKPMRLYRRQDAPVFI